MQGTNKTAEFLNTDKNSTFRACVDIVLSGKYFQRAELSKWRKALINRDKKCQVCSADTHLTAHHLHDWKNYPAKRFEIDNGILLCVKCHNDFHTINGKGGNTPNQFLDYLKEKGRATLPGLNLNP